MVDTMNNVELKTSYAVFEFKVKIEDVGECIILANVVKDDGKDLLEISLKTSEDSGLVHFVVGMYIDDSSESGIKAEIARLVDANYIDNFLITALADEEILEAHYNDKWVSIDGEQ